MYLRGRERHNKARDNATCNFPKALLKNKNFPKALKSMKN